MDVNDRQVKVRGVLVAVDESPPSQHALRWAHQYAGRTGRAVTALMAWDYIGQHHLHDDDPFDPHYSAASARSVVEQLVERCLGASSGVACEVVLGKAGESIVDAGTEADLIVVGARGLGGFRGLLLGSVSRHVVHHARVPVAIVRADPVEPDRPIVVGVDGSPASVHAVEWAVAAARLTAAPVIAIHAWRVPVVGSPYAAIAPDPASAAECGAEVLARTIHAADIGEQDAGAIEQRLVQGHPAGELLAAVDAASASLLVVGASGIGGAVGALLGSVSGHVAQHATCPVVIVPSQPALDRSGRVQGPVLVGTSSPEQG
jgi:nucleotide-binding universal stress UspA family protein